jgi:hypothetical protein
MGNWDLVPWLNKFDNNLIMKNPVWWWQVQQYSNKLNPNNNSMPLSFTLTGDDVVIPSETTTWTQQIKHNPAPYVFMFTEFSLCGGSGETHGHWNWFDATYEGKVYWDEYSGGAPLDGDYNILLVTPVMDATFYQRCGITWENEQPITPPYQSTKAIKLEFDSGETIDHWDDDPNWRMLHSMVDFSDDAARALIDGHDAVAIGTMGMDLGHLDSIKSELHPVHALAIRLNTYPSLDGGGCYDEWMFFARNWGDEGMCSTMQVYLPVTTLKLDLPKPVSDDAVAEVDEENVLQYNGLGSYIYKIKGSKTPISFSLPSGEQQGQYFGSLRLFYPEPCSASAISPSPFPSATSAQLSAGNISGAPLVDNSCLRCHTTGAVEAFGEPEDAMRHIWHRLTDEQRTEYLSIFSTLFPKASIEMQRESPEIVTTPPELPSRIPDIYLGPDLVKQKRDLAIMYSMCLVRSGVIPEMPSHCATMNFPPFTILTTTGGSPGQNGWLVTPATVTLTTRDASGQGIDYTAYSFDNVQWTPYAGPFVLPEGATTVYYRSKDNAGNLEETKQQTFMMDTTPPTISGNQIPAPNANGWNNTNVTVSFTCSDSGSGLAPGSPPANTVLTAEGANQTVTGTCTDMAGNSSSASVKVNIDKTPPQISCSAKPNLLWAPYHKLIKINVSVNVTDSGSGSAGFTLLSATSNEPDNGLGDGDMPKDIQGFVIGKPSISGQLRAERSGNGTGRIYTLTYGAADLAGNTANCTTVVKVPLSSK